MSALISYDDDPDDSTHQILKMTGLKHVAASKAAAPASVAPKAPVSVSADASDEDVDRALLASKIMKSLKRLKALDPDAGTQAQVAVDASDMDEALMDDLRELSEQISTAIKTAMEAD